jgi:hypothetical protein
MKHFYAKLLLLFIALALPLALFSVQQEQDNRSKAQSASFSFAAGGDFGLDNNFTSSINAISSSGVNFLFALGDLSYSGGSEQQWCNSIKAKIPNVIVIAGNHDVGESSGGDINQYRQHCPFTLGSLSGDYGKQYYFDYPQGAPLARFIAISPGLRGSVNIDYNYGGAGYNFTQQAIDDARSKGIKWIIVGMHKNCITPGTKSCEIGPDILKLLMDKRADLILQGHDHIYARTHTLTCFQVNTFDVSCVADNGSDGVHNYGEGSVLVIAGTSGRPLYEIKNVDGEKQYFVKMQDDTFGIPKFTVTQNNITAQFIRAGGGSFTDSFVIGTATGGPQPTNGNQPTSALSPAPTNITPTLYCLGGTPCTSPNPTSPSTPPGGGTTPNPSVSTGPIGGTNPTTNPNPSTAPCPTNASAGIMHNNDKKRSKSGGFIEQFIRFLLQLLQLILQRLGIQIPTNPNPGGNPIPTLTPGNPNPTQAPCPEPTTPVGVEQPTTTPIPSVQPTAAPSPTVFGQPSTSPAVTTAPGSMPAITVSGNKIMRGGQPWWFVGYNSFVWSGNCGNENEKMSAAQVEAWFATMRKDGHGAVRIYFWQGWNIDRLDHLIATAKKNNVYVTITVEEAMGYCGRQKVDDGWFTQQNKNAYKNHMSMLLNRYKGDTSIAWFEYFNEPDNHGTKLRQFFDEMGAHAATIDPNRLFSSGVVAPYWVDGEGNYRNIHESPGVDIASLHEYDGEQVESSHGKLARANSAGKPVIVGEAGFKRMKPWEGCDSDVTGIVNRVRNKSQVYKTDGYAGVFFWAWQPGDNCGKGLNALTEVHNALRTIN